MTLSFTSASMSEAEMVSSLTIAMAGDDEFVVADGVGCGVAAGVAAGVGFGVAGLGVVRRRWPAVTPNKTNRMSIERVSLAKFIFQTGARAACPTVCAVLKIKRRP